MANQWTLTTLRDRFYAQCEPVTESGCWLWTGTCSYRRYGFIKDNYKTKLAHRVSYELHFGAIPDGLFVCHRCDVPECVNPAHLFLGTATDNNQDKSRKGRCNPLLGADRPQAKLSADDVIAIRASGERGYLLARKYGVTPSTICVIKAGRSWRHLG